MRVLSFAVHCIAVGVIMFALMMLSFLLADELRAFASPAAQSTKPKPASVQTGWPKRRVNI